MSIGDKSTKAERVMAKTITTIVEIVLGIVLGIAFIGLILKMFTIAPWLTGIAVFIIFALIERRRR